MTCDVYFASDVPENTIPYLEEKAKDWYDLISKSSYLRKVITSWKYYYGEYYDDSHAINMSGETGELLSVAANHYRNLAQHMLNMITGTRPAFQCRSVNTDRKSMIQAELGNGILSYYMREERIERKIKKAVEYAIVMGSGYILTEWNATAGGASEYLDIDEEEVVDYDEHDRPLDENGYVIKPKAIYRGNIECRTLSPLDVIFDYNKEDPELNDWYLCRTFVNKFDLMSKYPEYKEELMDISVEQRSIKRISIARYNSEVDIPVYQFFHKKTEACPEGRYIYYINSDIVLDDTDLPYPDLPVQRISPADILGTSFGYTPMFDLIPLQEITNEALSTIVTNHSAYGVQNVINPMDNGVTSQAMVGGMNWIEYDREVGPPQALNLTNTSEHSYQLMNLVERTMETISGVNSVARGNPESSLKSGTALAMVQAQALQFMSGLQQTYIQLLEDQGTNMINILKQYADQPRVIAISGVTNTTKMQEFNNDDIQSINRVVVEVGNPLTSSTAGRVQIGENLLQMGLIKTPEKFLELINTGNLSNLTKGTTDELDTIRAENEAILKGQPVIAIAIDQHAMHIREHKAVLSDPVLRFDNDLVTRTLNHINEHMQMLRDMTDPALLSIIGEQPLGPQQGTPPNPQNVAPNQPNQAETGDMMEGEPQNPQDMTGIPNPAQPPGEFADLPQTPEELMNSQG